MTHLVISQTWLRDGEHHVAEYLALVQRFDAFLRSQPGFVSRRLVRSLEHPNHIIHLREFDDVASYEAMTSIAEYRAQIEALSEHVDGSAYPEGAVPREYGEILFESAPADS
ncbi:MAG: antibiotic biosynthesis monooxygenase family protein [Acidimicrobiales bacterium]